MAAVVMEEAAVAVVSKTEEDQEAHFSTSDRTTSRADLLTIDQRIIGVLTTETMDLVEKIFRIDLQEREKKVSKEAE